MLRKTVFVLGLKGLALAAAITASSADAANVAITEWMYDGSEYIEFTNVTGAAIDLTGWSFDDDSRAPGTVSLSGVGTLLPGQSAILSEVSAAEFRTQWGLSADAKVIGGNSANLGRADEINLFNATNQLEDRLAYGDQTFAGTVRAQGRSGNPTSFFMLDAPAANSTGWVLATTGDIYGSHLDSLGNIGNPGIYVTPLPAALPLLLSGLAGFAALRRRHLAKADDARGAAR
jgi:predicted extracellular nuclease